MTERNYDYAREFMGAVKETKDIKKLKNYLKGTYKWVSGRYLSAERNGLDKLSEDELIKEKASNKTRCSDFNKKFVEYRALKISGPYNRTEFPVDLAKTINFFNKYANKIDAEIACRRYFKKLNIEDILKGGFE